MNRADLEVGKSGRKEKAEAPGREPAAEKKERLKPGTRMISVFFLVFAGVFLWQSIGLYREDPTLAGYSTFPLIVSGFLFFLGVIDLIQNLRKESKSDGKGIWERGREMGRYLFPKDGVVFLLLTVAYYLMLEFGVGFVASSFLFLLLSMCYLIPKSFNKNLVYTIVCVAALYLIFKVIFKVFLP